MNHHSFRPQAGPVITQRGSVQSSSALLFQCLIILLLAAAPATAGPNNSAEATDIPLTWLSSDAKAVVAQEDSVHAWYRFGFTFQPSENIQSAHLVVTGNGTCSVYVNGQRVLRNVELSSDGKTSNAAGLDIRRLVRSGRNVVALEMHAKIPRVFSGVSLTVQSKAASAEIQSTVISGEWKQPPAAPPVGWAQTDFNDRDWTKAEATATAPDADFQVRLPQQILPAVAPAAGPRLPFYLQDGDHVVMLGSTFLERSQQFGHIEAALAAVAGTRRVTFRNLGWDGDTVFAESRGIFDSPEQGYLRMIEHVRAEEPTVVVLCYGQNDALTADRSPEQFRSQLLRLLDDLSTTGATLVMMAPHELLPAARPLPDSSRFNPRIRAYCEILQTVAAEKSAAWIDLFSGFTADLQKADRLLHISENSAEIDASPELHPDLLRALSARWSDNGLHLNNRGYQAAALVVRDRLLSIPTELAQIKISFSRQEVIADGAEVRKVVWSPEPDAGVQFEVREQVLSPLPAAVVLDDGLDAARCVGQVISEGTVQSLTIGTSGVSDAPFLVVPVSNRVAALRQTLIRKDELYFHRWRPQNITYLFGFRKHEQGNNAVEIAQFDPFVQELERKIHELQQSDWRTVNLKLTRNPE